MTWTSTIKDVDISRKVGHPSLDPAVSGRTPAVTNIAFSSLALFGAAARCTHLSVINPSIAKPESEMIRTLQQDHVDNINPKFSIKKSADNFKYYIKSYFAGTVVSGLSYIAMISDGYTWSDHFEKLTTGNTGKTPDFVFAGSGTGVAVHESKGSRGSTSGAFTTTVSDGYALQVEPHIGASSTVKATHSYCIGAYLNSTTSAELRIHHTAPPLASSSTVAADPSSITAVQRGNYANAFTLAHGLRLGTSIRTGDDRREPVIFLRFTWHSRRWLTSDGFSMSTLNEVAMRRRSMRMGHQSLRLPLHPLLFDAAPHPNFVYAVEEKSARAVLARFLPLNGHGGFDGALIDIPVHSFEQYAVDGDEPQRVVFPDGLAVIARDIPVGRVELVSWLGAERGIERL